MIVGNKTDLHKLREVKREDAAEYASSRNLACIETSALVSSNVDEAFNMIIKSKHHHLLNFLEIHEDASSKLIVPDKE